MNKRVYTFGSLGLAALLCAALFLTSERVQRAEKDYRHLMTQIADTKDSLRVLRAEWAYLNRPDRLEELAAHYLHTPSVQQTRRVTATARTPAPAAKEPVLQPIAYQTTAPIPTVSTQKSKPPVKQAVKSPNTTVQNKKTETFYHMMKQPKPTTNASHNTAYAYPGGKNHD
jgi:hypothetical protein